MNAKSEGITNIISEVEYLNTCTEAAIKAKLKSNVGVMIYIHKSVFGDVIVIFFFSTLIKWFHGKFMCFDNDSKLMCFDNDSKKMTKM